jgi:hypothetical protein
MLCDSNTLKLLLPQEMYITLPAQFSAYINRFQQPDTIVPNPANPQSWNRYAYTINNPLNYTDPSGHYVADTLDGECDLECVLSSQENNGSGNGNGRGDKDGECERGDAICQLRNHHDLDDPELWNHIALVSQDVATFVSSFGALVTIGSTISGCLIGTETGWLPGCVVGFAAGIEFHGAVTNPLETTLGYVSLYATFQHDLTTGTTIIHDNAWWDVRAWELSESSETSLVTVILGTASQDPFTDTLIDVYASGYNHGAFCGTSTILDCLP